MENKLKHFTNKLYKAFEEEISYGVYSKDFIKHIGYNVGLGFISIQCKDMKRIDIWIDNGSEWELTGNNIPRNIVHMIYKCMNEE